MQSYNAIQFELGNVMLNFFNIEGQLEVDIVLNDYVLLFSLYLQSVPLARSYRYHDIRTYHFCFLKCFKEKGVSHNFFYFPPLQSLMSALVAPV